jgi:hypothetical protein
MHQVNESDHEVDAFVQFLECDVEVEAQDRCRKHKIDGIVGSRWTYSQDFDGSIAKEDDGRCDDLNSDKK